MKFWELVSIFRSEPSLLEQLLQASEWTVYREWHQNFTQHVRSQNRTVLDAEVPNGLAERAMNLCGNRFRVQNGFLSQCSDEIPDALSARFVFDRYGASAIEEVLEKGSFRIPGE